MQVTHAKPAVVEENMAQQMDRKMFSKQKGVPFNAGLKTPCQCDSGKKFKHCCYAKSTIDWGWIVLGADNLIPVAIQSPEFSEHPVILVHPTFQMGTEYIQASDMSLKLKQKLVLVRMNIQDLCTHIEMQFAADQTLVVVVPEELTADGTGAVYEVVPGKSSTVEEVADA